MAALNQMELNSQRFMLAAAGIDTEGPVGMVKLQGAVLVYARTLDTWFEDDDPGLARTMAALDRELRRGGQFITGLNDICRMAAPFTALVPPRRGGRPPHARTPARPADGRPRYRGRWGLRAGLIRACQSRASLIRELNRHA